MTDTPQKIVLFDSIPDALKSLPQWVLWRGVERDGEKTKLPFRTNNRPAQSNNPKTWAAFSAVALRIEQLQIPELRLPNAIPYDGPGFVFSKDDPFVGIDLDGCRDPQTGEMAEWAVEIIQRFDTYAEISPSETGVKIFAKGNWPFDRGKKVTVAVQPVCEKRPGIEVYAHRRYFAVTGWQVESRPGSVEDCQAALDWLVGKYFAQQAKVQSTPQTHPKKVQERARNYLAKLPPAISGQRGHDATYHAACVLVQGFDLGADDAFLLLSEWSATCQPPWSEAELRHKIEDASQEPGERGYLLKSSRSNTPTESGNGNGSPQNDPFSDLPLPLPPPEMEFSPFPTDELPEPISRFVKEGAIALGCDESYIALPLLAVLASAVGNTRRIKLKNSWCEPCVFWAVIIGESGTLKSPAMDLALEVLNSLQDQAFRDYEEAFRKHELSLINHEAALKEWKTQGRKRLEPPPESPEEPIAERFVCEDTTVEAIAVLLLNQPRGILMKRDELSGWINSFDAYKSARGADVAHWLSMHRAGSLTVDRKTGRKVIRVPRSAVSLTGGVQPKTLKAALGGRYQGDGPEAMEDVSGEHWENGLAARLLVAMPPRKPKHWTEDDLSEETKKTLETIIKTLFQLDFQAGDDGELLPVDVPLSLQAKSVWIRFYNEHAREQTEMSGNLAAAWSKLEGYAARFALLIHLIRQATNDSTLVNPELIDGQSVRSGIALSRWFGDEAARVYCSFQKSGEDSDSVKRRHLLRVISEHSGRITVRELMQASRNYRESADTAESALNELRAAELGSWNVVKTKGRSRREFCLHDAESGPDRPQEQAEHSSSQDVDSGASPESENDEWGTI